ncbi:MAG: leucine-rich repeat domain-containing protein [Prevotella sp.]|nr:leucine-rich repeat domain-containing protein [Prevotella sp.]
MKQKNKMGLLLTIALTPFFQLFAYSISVMNEDGVTIYYNYINDSQELEVTYSSKKYSGNIKIPSFVTYAGRTRKVTSIGKNAFRYCQDLTSVTIPDSVTNIGEGAFYNCYGLPSITIPNNVTSIGDNAFSGCSGLKKVIVKDITAWYNISFGNYYSNPLYYANHLYSDENTEITNLVIPNSVTSIEKYAFEGCSGLASVTIPNSVTSIGVGAFSGCSGLKKVIVKDIAAWCNILLVIDPNVNSMGSNPLRYAHHLYSDENTEITNLVIPNSVTSIGAWAFLGCSELTSVTIPNNVTSIGMGTFYGCSGLTSITIPNSVTSIRSQAFNFTQYDLLEIKSYIEEPTQNTGSSFSDAIYKNATLYIPKGTMEKYKSTDGWKNFVFIEEGIPSGISSVSIDATEEERFNLRGEKLSTPQRGVNIIRMSDGTTKKVVVK